MTVQLQGKKCVAAEETGCSEDGWVVTRQLGPAWKPHRSATIGQGIHPSNRLSGPACLLSVRLSEVDSQ